ncbi:unnamed protein product [Sphagnum compactum]
MFLHSLLTDSSSDLRFRSPTGLLTPTCQNSRTASGHNKTKPNQVEEDKPRKHTSPHRLPSLEPTLARIPRFSQDYLYVVIIIIGRTSSSSSSRVTTQQEKNSGLIIYPLSLSLSLSLSLRAFLILPLCFRIFRHCFGFLLASLVCKERSICAGQKIEQ